MDEFLLILNATTCWYMTGVIWIVQLVHYPLFDRVSTTDFPAFAAAHQRRITWVVVIPMLAEAVAACGLLFLGPHGAFDVRYVAGVVLLGVIWFSTFMLQVPAHKRLLAGFDQPTFAGLVRTNWLRTAAWSLRSLLAVTMLLP